MHYICAAPSAEELGHILWEQQLMDTAIIKNYRSQKSDVILFSNCTTLLKIYFEIISKFFRAGGLFVCLKRNIKLLYFQSRKSICGNC